MGHTDLPWQRADEKYKPWNSQWKDQATTGQPCHSRAPEAVFGGK